MSRAQEIFPRAILGTRVIGSLALEAVGRSWFCIKSIYCITSLLHLFQIRTEEIINFMCFYHFVPLKEGRVLCYKMALKHACGRRVVFILTHGPQEGDA